MRKPIQKIRRKGEPAFVYLSVCHNAPAEKPPCARVDKKAALTQGLGSWRCTDCKRPCMCTRSRAKLDIKPNSTDTQ